MLHKTTEVRFPQGTKSGLCAANRAVERFCIHPDEWIPDEDNMLIQKLMLESNEPEFRRIANISRVA